MTGPYGQGAVADGESSRAAISQSTNISLSRGFISWLTLSQCSLALTSYQTGQLFLVGLTPEGKASFHQSQYTRAMGVQASGQRIILASDVAVWRLENVLAEQQRANDVYDALYVPRGASFTGDLDAHEVGLREDGQILFVNTKYSCLAVLSQTHSFKPVWWPPFISRLVPEDRCHLNGLAMEKGRARFVTAISRSDAVSGWRERRWEGGVVIDVQSNEILIDDLSMPHSPRLYDGALWVLDSGRGFLVRVDIETKTRQDVAFCPGFLRGLSFSGRFAVVTTSLPREGVFSDLELQSNLSARESEPRCAVYVIDIQTGGIAEWIEFSGHIRELFDVSVIAGVRCPSSIAASGQQMASLITIES